VLAPLFPNIVYIAIETRATIIEDERRGLSQRHQLVWLMRHRNALQ